MKKEKKQPEFSFGEYIDSLVEKSNGKFVLYEPVEIELDRQLRARANCPPFSTWDAVYGHQYSDVEYIRKGLEEHIAQCPLCQEIREWFIAHVREVERESLCKKGLCRLCRVRGMGCR